ncbi:hypothetical protein [Nocardia rhizosphaerae]|uniref:N-acetyltransferase domain-containing protein n=1 Tax=Nocardia rhizosphaerae TaxID=1691571 RepID=A0ABV8LCQ5_9NOCA
MSAGAVEMVTSLHDVLDALTVPYAVPCIEEWISEGQLYRSDAVPFLTGIDVDPVTGVQTRIVRFGAVPTPTAVRAMLGWAGADGTEEMLSVEVPGAADLLHMPCSQIYVERAPDDYAGADVRRSALADAPAWVVASLETSLRNGAAARGLVFEEPALAGYLACLLDDPDCFACYSPSDALAAVLLLVEDDWDGCERLELFDLVGADTRQAEPLLASAARLVGVDRVRGTVTMGSDTRGPKVWAALRGRGWRRIGCQVIAKRHEFEEMAN